MSISGKDPVSAPAAIETQDAWSERKKAMLEKLSAHGQAAGDGGAIPSGEKEEIFADIERLEEENNQLAKHIKERQNQLSEKREAARILIKRADGLKKELDGHLAKERGYLNEIDFFESEKARLSDQYLQVSARLDQHLSSLDATVKDIGFLTGETEMLMNQMGVFEEDVPVKREDMDLVDDRFYEAVALLIDIYHRMRDVERKFKLNYYKNKKC